MKPHFKVVANRPVQVERPQSSPAVQAAREKFGQPFAHQKGSTWKPRETPFLLEWLTKKGRA